MSAVEKRGAVDAVAIRVVLLLGALVVLGGSASAQCVGDCDGDNEVRVNEAITGVNILLGNADLSACPSFDSNGDGNVAVNELIQAVNNLLRGCDAPPPPTPTPTPVVTSASCVLSDASTLTLDQGLFQIGPLPASAEFLLECTEPAGAISGLAGDLPCTCEIERFDPVNIPGVGDVCVEPFSPCPSRFLSCEGGVPNDVTLTADHNIGDCTGNADCASQCESYCDDVGAGNIVQTSTCEDFCSGGENDGEMCLMDTDCPGGSCGGPDGGTSGPICNCVCARPEAGAAAAAGGFSCGLGFSITVELDNNGICGDVPPTITLDPVCGELTTGTSQGELRNAADSPGVTIGPTTLMGAPANCAEFAAGSTSGTNLVGHLAFFGSAVGDLLVENNFVCE